MNTKNIQVGGETPPRTFRDGDILVGEFQEQNLQYLMSRAKDMAELLAMMEKVTTVKEYAGGADKIVTIDLDYVRIVEDQKSAMNYPYQLTPKLSVNKEPVYYQDFAQVLVEILRRWW